MNLTALVSHVAAATCVVGGMVLAWIAGRTEALSRGRVWVERDKAWRNRVAAIRNALQTERSLWAVKVDHPYDDVEIAQEKSPNLIVEVARELLATRPTHDEDRLVTEARRALHLEHIGQRIKRLEEHQEAAE